MLLEVCVEQLSYVHIFLPASFTALDARDQWWWILPSVNSAQDSVAIFTAFRSYYQTLLNRGQPAVFCLLPNSLSLWIQLSSMQLHVSAISQYFLEGVQCPRHSSIQQSTWIKYFTVLVLMFCMLHNLVGLFGNSHTDLQSFKCCLTMQQALLLEQWIFFGWYNPAQSEEITSFKVSTFSSTVVYCR